MANPIRVLDRSAKKKELGKAAPSVRVVVTAGNFGIMI